MTREEMKYRTKDFANRVVRLCAALPNNWVARAIGGQLLRSGTSVGANYRAVCRAKSNPDFINKLRIVEEECDESLFWMELLVDNNLVKASRFQSLILDADHRAWSILCNPFRVEEISGGRLPRVAPCRPAQPWAGRCNPFGVDEGSSVRKS